MFLEFLQGERQMNACLQMFAPSTTLATLPASLLAYFHLPLAQPGRLWPTVPLHLHAAQRVSRADDSVWQPA